MAVSAFAKRQGKSIIEFWKTLGDDYVSTVKGAIDQSKEKPWKAVVCGMTVSFLAYAYGTNPDEKSMLNDMRERRQQMALIPSSSHNNRTDSEMSLRTRLLNQNRLEHYNFVFFSLLVRREHPTDMRQYRTQDSNLTDWASAEVLKNVMDIGFLGKWYSLERAFVDYDVNQEEFQHEILPPGSH